MNNKPCVSVVMSVYNGEKYLRESIESILNQTFRNFEFIIIDDGSKDNSLKIVNEYKSKDERLILIQNEKNIGLPTSLNKGIKIAKGKYIARQDADDISVNYRLEIQHNHMEKYPNIDILGSDNYSIDVEDYIFSETTVDMFNVKKMLLSENYLFAHGSVIIRRDVFDDVGLYNQSFYYNQDLEYWMRCYLKGKRIERMSDLLYKFRVSRYSGEMQEKNLLRDRLNNILISAFREGLISGEFDIDEEKSQHVLKDFVNNNHDRNKPDKCKDDRSGYWFHIARQALRSGKQKKYVRKCLYKSLLTKDISYRCVMKIAFLVLTYFNFDYKGIDTSWFRKFWS